jgi:hypothetical protein
VLQPGTASPSVGGQSGDISAARFPLIRAIYPLSERLVLSVGFGSYLEQSWGVRLTSEEVIGDETVQVTDVIEANGAVARLSAGVAYRVTPSLALGVAGGLYTGNLDRRVSRTFGDSTAALIPFDTRLGWNYHGTFGSAGIRVDLRDAFRFGASVTLSQKLEIDGIQEDARDDEARIPIRLAAGASGTISSTILAVASAEWNGGEEGAVFQATDANALQRDTWRVGGGIEYGGLQSGRNIYPIRIGANWTQLPFYNAGETPGDERALGIGIGFRLAGDEAGPLAVADIAVERGKRSGLESTAIPGGLKESFWRLTFSLSLFGS